MRTIAIGDIHGCYNELKNLISSLENSGKYNKDTDRIIFLGDYIDRGKDSKLVIEFIRNMQKNNNNVIALMGNHEDMLINYWRGIDDLWIFNGHHATIDSYNGNKKQLHDDIAWMRNLPLYYEDEHFIYVHAGVDVNKPIKKQNKDTLLWIREEFINSHKKYYKKVIFGHTPTIALNGMYNPVYTFTNNIAIDTGCVFGGALSAVIINDGKIEEFYQVDKEDEEDSNTKYYKKYINV